MTESKFTECTEEGGEKAESGNAEKLKLNFERFEEAGLEEKAEKLKLETLKNKQPEESGLADSPVSDSLTRAASGSASALRDSGVTGGGVLWIFGSWSRGCGCDSRYECDQCAGRVFGRRGGMGR
jgi:hypothetical protein